MKTLGMVFALALVCSFTARSAAAQEAAVTSHWSVSSVSGKDQPKGYVQYENLCAICHGDAHDRPGTLALQAKYKGALPAVLDRRTDLTPELIRTSVRNGTTVMPLFRKTEISDADLDAIVAYLTRNNKH
jgi:(+)-pinoresinol hydroxylase